MRLLKSTVHPDLSSLDGKVLERVAARAIVLKGEEILLMYTERYHDYTLPGGGVDQGENLIEGLKRELSEETGAQNVRDIQAFGCYEEYRPWYKDDADYMHMLSYCYLCQIDDELAENALEKSMYSLGSSARQLVSRQIMLSGYLFLLNARKSMMSAKGLPKPMGGS